MSGAGYGLVVTTEMVTRLKTAFDEFVSGYDAVARGSFFSPAAWAAYLGLNPHYEKQLARFRLLQENLNKSITEGGRDLNTQWAVLKTAVEEIEAIHLEITKGDKTTGSNFPELYKKLCAAFTQAEIPKFPADASFTVEPAAVKPAAVKPALSGDQGTLEALFLLDFPRVLGPLSPEVIQNLLQPGSGVHGESGGNLPKSVVPLHEVVTAAGVITDEDSDTDSCADMPALEADSDDDACLCSSVPAAAPPACVSVASQPARPGGSRGSITVILRAMEAAAAAAKPVMSQKDQQESDAYMQKNLSKRVANILRRKGCAGMVPATAIEKAKAELKKEFLEIGTTKRAGDVVPR